MSPEFSGLVDPVIQQVLGLVSRIESGERVDLMTERNAIRSEIDEAAKTAAAPSSPVRRDDFELAKEAIVYWTDEVVTQVIPEWKDIVLETEYYGTRDRAWKFYVDGEQKARHASPDVVETWYLALVLGFEGDIRDAFKQHLKRDLPGGGEDVKAARTVWAKQLEQRIRESSLPERPAEPLVGHVAPLSGKSRLLVAATICGLLALLLVVLLYFQSAGTFKTFSAG